MKLTPMGRWLAATLVAATIVVGVAWSWQKVRDGEGCTGILGRPLRVGIVTWPGYAGGIVANNGFAPTTNSTFYREHELCVQFMLMEDMNARRQAFERGGETGVDVVWSTVDFWANELPAFLKKGIKAHAIMQVDWSRGGDAIVADSTIQRIEDLYQKKVSLALFTPSHWLLHFNLQSSALGDAKRHEINRGILGKDGSPAALAAFVAGEADAAVVWEPDVSAALNQRRGSHVLVSTKDARKLIADVMVAREDFIRDHYRVIQAFVAGWLVDGAVAANRDPETVVRLLMANEPVYQQLGAEVTRRNLSTVEWAGMADNAEMFNLDGLDPVPLYDRLFSQAAKTWLAYGYIPAQALPTDSRDDSFLRDLYRSYPAPRVPDEAPKPAADAGTRAPLAERALTVEFAVDSAGLDMAARQLIDEQLSLQSIAYSGAFIRVEGNTDNRGGAARNMELSRRRAQAVVDYLVEHYHLPAEHFIVLGHGETKPVANNATEQGRALNRRTDVSVVRQGPSNT